MALVAEQSNKISEAARSLCIGANLMRRWQPRFEKEVSAVRLGGDEREELVRLREDVSQLWKEKKFLKKPASSSRRK